MYCASSTHTVTSCPAVPPRAYSTWTPNGVGSPARGYRVSWLITAAARFSATLTWQGQTLTVPLLIDSGADESFVDLQFA